MEKILISACLAGDLVRYDARRVPVEDMWIKSLLQKEIFIKCCPEVTGGMDTPRPPAQIVGGDGYDVLAGRAKVLDVNGRDVTGFFLLGAESSLSMAKNMNVRAALLKEKSPSCGSGSIYDGSFTSALIPGAGVTAALFVENGINVFSEKEIMNFKTFVNQNLSIDNF